MEWLWNAMCSVYFFSTTASSMTMGGHRSPSISLSWSRSMAASAPEGGVGKSNQVWPLVRAAGLPALLITLGKVPGRLPADQIIRERHSGATYHSRRAHRRAGRAGFASLCRGKQVKGKRCTLGQMQGLDIFLENHNTCWRFAPTQAACSGGKVHDRPPRPSLN